MTEAAWVPVDKERLLVMAEARLVIAEKQARYQYEKWIQYFVEEETKRSSKRRWFGMAPPRKPRFDLETPSRKDLIKVANADAPWSRNPFVEIKERYDDVSSATASWKRLAESRNSGDPILLAYKVFQGLDNPNGYDIICPHWGDMGRFTRFPNPSFE